jgi:DNA-binding HxlR family transcriptional regulator
LSSTRRYRLLCPIARGLDHVGDRWTLLLLRDLHAAPARFTDLQTGFPGLASNLLTERLRRLEADGFIQRRRADYGVTLYELTEFGESTSGLLFALGQLGSHFPPDKDVERPPNLRTLAVTLKEAIRQVIDPATSLHAGLVVDGEEFEIAIDRGDVEVRYRTPVDVEVSIATEYEPFMAVGDSGLSLQAFVEDHVHLIEGDPAKFDEFIEILGRAFGALVADKG